MKNYYDFDTDTIHYKGKQFQLFSNFSQQESIKNYVKDNLIMLCVGGSHAYGLNTETSDIDIRGIFKDNIDMLLGYNKVESLENSTNDIVIYALTKALHLIIEQNPNMQELLWVDEEEILYANETYWYLRSLRYDMLSKLAKHKYSGYAVSQLKRMKGHNKWLNKEQEGKFDKKPNIKDYIIFIEKVAGHVSKLSEMNLKWDQIYFTKVKDEIYNMWHDDLNAGYPLIEEGNNFLPIREDRVEFSVYQGNVWFNKSQFQIDLDEYNKWKTWKENRNKARHELEEKYGMDTKHASHTFRLLNTGCEILRGEGVKVKRPDKDFLLDIRNGKYSYEYIIEEATRIDTEVLPELYEKSTLQHSVDPYLYVKIIKKILEID